MTEVYRLNSPPFDESAISRAANVLRGGGLVAFPTETVYGLGANALDPAAVARIFDAKGRPPNNPLIVHVGRIEQARELAAEWPDAASRLAARFWPGPLTLVLAKRRIVPDVVTAGAATVGLRIPAHPVAQALLEAAGVPVAAPSANRSNELSPTTAEHVLKGLDGRIDIVLDAGPTSGGLESTVLDLTTTPPRILRPGLVSPAEIAQAIDSVEWPSAEAAGPARSLISPGRLPRHYAPRALMECRADDGADRVKALTIQGLRIGWLALAKEGWQGRAFSDLEVEVLPLAGSKGVVLVSTIRMPPEPAAYAARLYAALHTFDELRVDRIVVDLPPDEEPWLAIRDRLRRGAVQ